MKQVFVNPIRKEGIAERIAKVMIGAVPTDFLMDAEDRFIRIGFSAQPGPDEERVSIFDHRSEVVKYVRNSNIRNLTGFFSSSPKTILELWQKINSPAKVIVKKKVVDYRGKPSKSFFYINLYSTDQDVEAILSILDFGKYGDRIYFDTQMAIWRWVSKGWTSRGGLVNILATLTDRDHEVSVRSKDGRARTVMSDKIC